MTNTYIDRYLIIDKNLDKEFKYISRELPKQYETPKLIEQKEFLLQKRKFLSSMIVIGLICILILVTYFYYKSRRREKIYQEKAVALLDRLNKKEPNIINVDSLSEALAPKSTERINLTTKEKLVPVETVNMILIKLEEFEKQKLFLIKGITLHSLAKDFDTNSTYLSEVINSHKEMNFASFLNHLRIEYAITQLSKDKKIRSYKISALAEILGYNNEQAFSIAFKKKTDTTVSVFVKEIERNTT